MYFFYIHPFQFLGYRVLGYSLALIGPYIQSEKNQSKSLTIDFWFLGYRNLGDTSHASHVYIIFTGTIKCPQKIIPNIVLRVERTKFTNLVLPVLKLTFPQVLKPII